MKHIGMLAVGFAFGTTLTYFVMKTDSSIAMKPRAERALVVTEAAPAEVDEAEQLDPAISAIQKQSDAEAQTESVTDQNSL